MEIIGTVYQMGRMPKDIYRHELRSQEYDIFVSHKGEDMCEAEKVAETISKNGLEAYLDKWDPSVNGDGVELVHHLRNRVSHCKGLVAVITEKTHASWWVPYEICMADEKKKIVSSYISDLRDHRRRPSIYTKPNYLKVLPSYLWEKAILCDEDDIRKWCEQFKRSKFCSVDHFYSNLKSDHPDMFK